MTATVEHIAGRRSPTAIAISTSKARATRCALRQAATFSDATAIIWSDVAALGTQNSQNNPCLLPILKTAPIR
jgi:hypothetical protein